MACRVNRPSASPSALERLSERQGTPALATTGKIGGRGRLQIASPSAISHAVSAPGARFYRICRRGRRAQRIAPQLDSHHPGRVLLWALLPVDRCAAPVACTRCSGFWSTPCRPHPPVRPSIQMPSACAAPVRVVVSYHVCTMYVRVARPPTEIAMPPALTTMDPHPLTTHPKPPPPFPSNTLPQACPLSCPPPARAARCPMRSRCRPATSHGNRPESTLLGGSRANVRSNLARPPSPLHNDEQAVQRHI